MKFNQILFLIIFFPVHVIGQTSYRLELDTVYKDPSIEIGIDGNVVIGIPKSQVKVIKLDSLGNIIWSTNYGFPNSANYSDPWGIQIAASPDSGYQVLAWTYEDMFGWFATSYFRKIDKDGIQVSYYKTTGVSGEKLDLGPVNKNNGDLYGYGVHTQYDGVCDCICCASYYDLTFNNNSLVTSKTTQNLFPPFFTTYDSIGTTSLIGRDDWSSHFGYYQIRSVDTLKNTLWDRRFYHDTTLISDLILNDFKEINGEKYFVLSGNYAMQNRVCIHKLDAQWNTIYFKVLESNVSSPYAGNWKLGVTDDERLIIAGIQKLGSSTTYNSIIIELDSTGNAINASFGSDGRYINSMLVDAKTGSALFFRKTNNPGIKILQFERVYPSSTSCNYLPYPVTPIDLLITDSLFANNFIPGGTGFPSTAVAVSNPPVQYTPLMNPICGVFSAISDSESNVNCTISVSNSVDEIYLNSECKLMENSEIRIFDTGGKLIQQISTGNINFPYSISIKSLKSGMYFLSVYLENKDTVGLKFIVN